MHTTSTHATRHPQTPIRTDRKPARAAPGKRPATARIAPGSAITVQLKPGCPACADAAASDPAPNWGADPWLDAALRGNEPAKSEPKKCATCGGESKQGGTCSACAAKGGDTGARADDGGHDDHGDRADAPGKAQGEGVEDTSAKPRPLAGAATIQCDGSGGWEVVLNSYASAKCGTKDCVTAHEESHIEDWKAKWPNGCKDQPKGYLPKGDPPDDPLMTVDEYNAFLKKSECKAHTVDLNCAKKLPKEGECKDTVEDYIKLTETQKANWC